ncbi:MAG TPA: HepT-like ribonuclease domain-containing protein [Pseudonocardia sp.]|uniref:HepT-like ribonuclease domain-containing protein n=1 Tax=Pseudonocardia sp. TaxID=60912 RepID=UPI002B66777B|nr:HepT-like ribonuclease domain-containing protein [Pseudonocardia sp.]HTF47546.1 HepT-like ribonuclease domain-containing protein [Pseudonocardia sp.]
MRPDPRKYLWDALRAAERLGRFAHGKSFADYQADELLKSAVERQFEIIGEALNQLSKVSPELAEQVPELPRIVAFRNILIHGYAMVDDALVWQVLTDKRPVLDQALRKLLADLSD